MTSQYVAPFSAELHDKLDVIWIHTPTIDSPFLDASLPETVEREEASQRSAETHYEAVQVLAIRNALKFSAKVWGEEPDFTAKTGLLPYCSHSAEVGFLLALSRESADTVVAGLLYQATYHNPNSLKNSEMTCMDVIAKKFGPRVVALIEAIEDTSVKLDDHPAEFVRDVHALRCAVEIVREASGYTSDAISTPRSELLDRIRTYRERGVGRVLLDQFKVEFGLSFRNAREIAPDAPWSVHDVVDIRNSLRTAFWLFRDKERKWGPSEHLPLAVHQAEVGLLAVLGGGSRDLICASTLHDSFEGYVQNPTADEIREVLYDRFGARVVQLVEGVTEPPKICDENGFESIENWRLRKQSVIAALEQGDAELATLSCTTKASTIAAGNKFVYVGGQVEDWSSGPHAENVDFFIRHLELFHSLGVPGTILDQFELEISRFVAPVLNSRARNASVRMGA